MTKPEILAPAGSRESFMAALAAGADAIYLGLKNFSARMQADNFSLPDLSGLVDLAHSEQTKIYIALNTILKPSELDFAGSQIKFLAKNVKPDALIVQDIGAIDLARQAGFEGEIHLSTLANVTHQSALKVAKDMGANRVILPRELSIDEIKNLSDACPPGLELEMFVHGALCFCVSGRCYWSSYMGGKSSLRGQCVQPCRRIYKQRSKESTFFSCLDLSLDLLVKTLLPVENLTSWKLEGRRKGPHYVYYVTTAYKMLRDNPSDPAVKKDVEELLKMALGRTGTNARFLPQKVKDPTVPHSSGEETASGMFMGRVSVKKGQGVSAKAKEKMPGKTKTKQASQPYDLQLKPWHPLLAGDYFRIGNEDNPWHYTFSIKRAVPKGGALTISPPKGKFPPAGAPIFLLDRREPELSRALTDWEAKAKKFPAKGKGLPDFNATLPTPPDKPTLGRAGNDKDKKKNIGPLSIILKSSIPQGREAKIGIRPGVVQGLWMTRKTVDEISKTLYSRISWWLPPVIWPDEEANWKKLVGQAVSRGAKHFVCNSPWQIGFFNNNTEEDNNPHRQKLDLTAGPFCNTSNALALAELAALGFNSAIVGPELSGEEILSLPAHSPIPLGIVLSGFWPVGISRHSFSGGKLNEVFSSPKREMFWARHYGQNLWIYPGWPLDIKSHYDQLVKNGYKTFVQIDEYLPKEFPEPKRTSPFNWDLGLL